MSHFTRFLLLEMNGFIRLYGTKRSPQNYYEILQIPPNSSQQDIREAFLKLSKEMHPDVTVGKDHAEFVKMNEAYSVLSKEKARQQYDAAMRNTNRERTYYDPYQTYRPTSHKEWEQMYRVSRDFRRMQQYRYKPVSPVWILVSFIIMAFGTMIQLFLLHYSPVFNRQRLLEKSARFEQEYNLVVSRAQGRTCDEQIDDFKKRVETEQQRHENGVL